jgi:hypothetical protein
MGWHFHKKAIFFILSLTAVLAFGRPQSVYAASTLDVLPSGEGVFVIQGTGIEGAEAMDITVVYDSSTLSNPRVVQGGLISGAMMVVNDKSQGAVRLGIIRVTPVRGNGVIATLMFDRTGSSAGKILSLAVKAFKTVDKQSIPLPVVARITNPADSSSDASGPSQKQDASRSAGAAASAGGAASMPLGVVVAQGDGSVLASQKDQTASVSSGETQTPGETPAGAKASGATSGGPGDITASLEPQKKKVQQYESVLERFRKHRKERTEKAFLSLFDQGEASGFRQEPQVVLSDGKATVKVFFVVSASGGSAPDFALRGAKLVSVKQDADRSNTWVIEARPEKGEYEASLLVPRGDVILEYPLTLAPKISLSDKSGPVTDEDFSRYLSAKKRDLNGDGKRDYLDDYIFTANFIAARQKQ